MAIFSITGQLHILQIFLNFKKVYFPSIYLMEISKIFLIKNFNDSYIATDFKNQLDTSS